MSKEADLALRVAHAACTFCNDLHTFCKILELKVEDCQSQVELVEASTQEAHELMSTTYCDVTDQAVQINQTLNTLVNGFYHVPSDQRNRAEFLKMVQEKELSAALFDEQILFAAEHSTKPSWENGIKRQLSGRWIDVRLDL